MKTQRQILYSQFKKYIDAKQFDYTYDMNGRYEIISINFKIDCELTIINSYDENDDVYSTHIELLHNEQCGTKDFINVLKYYNLKLYNPASWMDTIFALVNYRK